MRRYSLFLLFSIALLANCLHAQYYWFQTGAAAQTSTNNNGAGVTIRTVAQHPQSGSFGFWVGELLKGGGFIQMGYIVENASGYYPASCTIQGCNDTEYIGAGDAEWFYEYFLNSSTDSFLGEVGPNDSAGLNSSVHTYQFYSKGNEWYFLMDGNVVGSVQLNTGSSGNNGPVAFAELSNSSNPYSVMSPVNFSNLTEYVNGKFRPVEYGYAYIGYGVSSATGYKNPFGVEEVSNAVDDFEVGSGLPRPANNTLLWTLGYFVKVNSTYAIKNSTGEYSAYSITGLSVPEFYYINNGTRAVFKGWRGVGDGSYTGTSNTTDIMVNGNMSETATWQLQYYLNVSSAYGNASGSGWYDANSTASYGIKNAMTNESQGARVLFVGWNGSSSEPNGTVLMNGPKRLDAVWQQQYYANVTSAYGNASGSGWYANGSVAQIRVLDPVSNISGSERLAFYSWSNGNQNATINETITGPLALQAQFKDQYLVSLEGENEYGTHVNPSVFYVGGKAVDNRTFLYQGEGYRITGAEFDGILMPLNQSFVVSGASAVPVALPLYNVEILTYDIFGMPVNASGTLTLPNGSSKFSSGRDGTLLVSDVPYGNVSGRLEYLGTTEIISTGGGKVAKVVFVSEVDFAAFVLVVALSAGFYVYASRRHARLERA